jgi:hypothetical protein
MNKVLAISSDNPSYDTKWKINIWFGDCTIEGMRGHSTMKGTVNITVPYKDSIWDVNDCCRRFLVYDYALPWLIQNGYVEEDEDGWHYPTNKLKDYIN